MSSDDEDNATQKWRQHLSRGKKRDGSELSTIAHLVANANGDISKIPVQVMAKIVFQSGLDFYDVSNFCATNRYFHEFCTHDKFEPYWMNIFTHIILRPLGIKEDDPLFTPRLWLFQADVMPHRIQRMNAWIQVDGSNFTLMINNEYHRFQLHSLTDIRKRSGIVQRKLSNYEEISLKMLYVKVFYEVLGAPGSLPLTYIPTHVYKLKSCIGCNASLTRDDPLVCIGCGTPYCGEDCYTKHLPQHRLECKK